jgi:hypothetical protein
VALYTVQPNSVVNAADVNQFTNLLNGTTTAVQVTVASRIRAQLTGATTGTGGYVGEGPALSAPTSGTFVAGDFVSDGTGGMIWVCTAGGTPGTWATGPTRIATTTLGGTTASVTFSSIPAFNHISVTWKARSTTAVAAEQMYLRFNGDTASHYQWQTNEANAGNAVTGSHSTTLVAFIQIATITGASGTANYFASGEFRVPYWNDTTNFAVAQGTATAQITTTNQYAGTYGGLYNQAATLTSLTLFPAGGSFAAGCRFSLYGWM